DQRIEVVKKLRVYLNKRLAAAARASNATFFERCRQVLQAPANRTRRTSRNTRDGGNPAIARGLRFARRKKTPTSFVEMRRQVRSRTESSSIIWRRYELSRLTGILHLHQTAAKPKLDSFVF